MKPEEHYARGLELLDLAERSTDVGAVHATGVLAQTHFSAATAGAAMSTFGWVQRAEAREHGEPASEATDG